MVLRLGHVWNEQLATLRWEPCAKRIRALRDGRTIVDTTRALLVWPPRKVVPSYAVPLAELEGPVGEGGVRLEAELEGYVLLKFEAFDRWLEEEEPIFGHPADPFHRVDIRQSSRHVRIEAGSMLLAESTRPTLVFETHLPLRVYLPRADVRAELRPSTTRTVCAYKGEASYVSVMAGGQIIADAAWIYEAPVLAARGIAGQLAFYDDRVSITLDGVRLGSRP